MKKVAFAFVLFFCLSLLNNAQAQDYKSAIDAITSESIQNTMKQIINAGNVMEVVMMPKE